jgi:ABC-type molybdenum transport system ATPase subunit/photorepair protein PhrA
MAKQNGTAAKPPEPAAERLPAYFLSLTLENVRCFGPKQTLNLATKDGKPAPWTIILGVNGTGKTTLLQSLASCEQLRPPFGASQLDRWIPQFVARERMRPPSPEELERK